MAEQESKTEQPTSRKLRKARDEGQVAKSAELPSVSVIFIAMLVLYLFGFMMYSGILDFMRHSFTFNKIPEVGVLYSINLLGKVSWHFIKLVLPFMAAIFVMALASNIAQIGLKFTLKPLEPKLSKFNVIKGFKRLVSVKAFGELLKSLLKLGIIATVVFFVLRNEMDNLPKLFATSVPYIFLYMMKTMFKMFIWAILIMLLVAILDFAFQKWKFNKDMMMTKEEIKEEHKQSEGDPHVKSRIRTLQLQAARKRMMQKIPDADVVVTNPTHLALAIKYDPLSQGAPTIVAKGAGVVAEKIKEIAKKHNIPVIEDKPLAQNLYKIVDVDEEIPMQLYQAVAELLAYVYKLKGKTVR
ncbi:MAG: flagellar biosynthesis protein FlhB [Desulfobacterales bacterium]|nr:flagellar biosynthesis protein FlhB [Desulfobacterales bacterium]